MFLFFSFSDVSFSHFTAGFFCLFKAGVNVLPGVSNLLRGGRVSTAEGHRVVALHQSRVLHQIPQSLRQG